MKSIVIIELIKSVFYN